MIKIEKTNVSGWEAAIRGMRNPWNSWDKSDTCFAPESVPIIGKNDLKRMKQLAEAGTDHSKFMRMITVTVDITAPLYWWKEFDTYKVGTVRNSCSTMHKIADKEFTLDDFSHEHLFDNNIVNAFNEDFKDNLIVRLNSRAYLQNTIDALNFARDLYLKAKNEPMKNDTKKKSLMKKCWWQMIQLLPSSYNQRATVQLNYAVLRNMYHSRKNHKLDEWSQGFTEWVKSLPYSELITHYADENKRMKEPVDDQSIDVTFDEL